MFLKIHQQFFNLDTIKEVTFFKDAHNVWFVRINFGKEMPRNYMIAHQSERDFEILAMTEEVRQQKGAKPSWEVAEEAFHHDLMHMRVADLTPFTVNPNDVSEERKRVEKLIRSNRVAKVS